ncbi:MAG: transcriptional regulator [Opitutaceae bacterium]|jgi:RNA polymerase-binding transcription factor DksA|nr:transcriptional regulator [Opitutaceae bacterium]
MTQKKKKNVPDENGKTATASNKTGTPAKPAPSAPRPVKKTRPLVNAKSAKTVPAAKTGRATAPTAKPKPETGQQPNQKPKTETRSSRQKNASPATRPAARRSSEESTAHPAPPDGTTDAKAATIKSIMKVPAKSATHSASPAKSAKATKTTKTAKTPKARSARNTAGSKSAGAVPDKAKKHAAPASGGVVRARPESAVTGKASGKATGKASAKDRLRSSILARREKPAKPIAFTLDEVREIARQSAAAEATPEQSAAAIARARAARLAEAEKAARPATPNRVQAASLADILGFNPAAKKSVAETEESQIPEKFRRYYKLLIDLRRHASGQLESHTEETLKRSAKDDAGDLSSYGQHMADAGTDTFDRDFALSMVASEQEALSEIDAAIQRIKAGTYGICEITQKPIARDRLLAVPFTRYSTEAQKEVEKTRYRPRGQAGLLAELGEDGGKMMDDADVDE